MLATILRLLSALWSIIPTAPEPTSSTALSALRENVSRLNYATEILELPMALIDDINALGGDIDKALAEKDAQGADTVSALAAAQTQIKDLNDQIAAANAAVSALQAKIAAPAAADPSAAPIDPSQSAPVDPSAPTT